MSRGFLSRFVIRACLVMVVAGAGAVRAQDGLEPLPTLTDVNEALDDRQATLELGSDREMTGARKVLVAADFTTFRFDGREQQIPTSEVLRITLEPQRRTRAGLGWGLLAGLGVALFGIATSESTGTPLDATADAAFMVGSVAVGGLVGSLIGYSRRLPERVVYDGPVERYLGGATGSSADDAPLPGDSPTP
jgi:hypothetical protein